MQAERIGPRTVGTIERHATFHQSRNEVDVSGKPIQLGNQQRGPGLAGVGEPSANLGRDVPARFPDSTSVYSATISPRPLAWPWTAPRCAAKPNPLAPLLLRAYAIVGHKAGLPGLLLLLMFHGFCSVSLFNLTIVSLLERTIKQ